MIRPASLLAIFILCCLPTDAVAKGLIYGDGHAFFVSAPSGWVLDNKSGVNQGLHAVFYPEKGSWKDSPNVMYVNTCKREAGTTLEAFVAEELSGFRRGQASLRIMEGDPINTLGGRSALVRYLSGDQWANREAIAYIGEKKVFVFVVLTARTPETYADSLVAFTALVESYEFITDDPPNATGQFDLIEQLAKDNTKTPQGAAYDKACGQTFGSLHAETMRRCFLALDHPDPSNFDILVRVSADGRPEEILVRPETNVAFCLREAMKKDRYPPPPESRYWVHIGMRIRP